MKSHHFNNNEELSECVKTWLGSWAADFFDTGIQKLNPQYHKCLNFTGDYAEKYLKYVHVCMYIIISFLLLVLLTTQWNLLSE
jgi:hypothetical protein